VANSGDPTRMFQGDGWGWESYHQEPPLPDTNPETLSLKPRVPSGCQSRWLGLIGNTRCKCCRAQPVTHLPHPPLRIYHKINLMATVPFKLKLDVVRRGPGQSANIVTSNCYSVGLSDDVPSRSSVHFTSTHLGKKLVLGGPPKIRRWKMGVLQGAATDPLLFENPRSHCGNQSCLTQPDFCQLFCSQPGSPWRLHCLEMAGPHKNVAFFQQEA